MKLSLLLLLSVENAGGHVIHDIRHDLVQHGGKWSGRVGAGTIVGDLKTEIDCLHDRNDEQNG